MASKTDRFSGHIHPVLRFGVGLILMLLTLFQRTWWGALAQCTLYWIMGSLSGKRIHLGYFFFLVLTITFFQSLSPVGKVLIQWGPFTITELALWEGLKRGLHLVSLVFLSLFAISPRLKLPGFLGGLLARSFAYFEALTTAKKALNPRDLVASIDLLFERIYIEGGGQNLQSPQEATTFAPVRTTVWGWLALGGLTLCTLFLTILV